MSSTAIPNATLAVITEPISIGRPNHPIAPNTNSGGKTFGIIATKPALMLFRTIMSTIEMNRNAVIKLFFRSLRI